MKPTFLICFFAFVGVIGLASAQDTSKPVEYVARALPLHQVLLDLEKKTGVRLDCDHAMENEPLILKLNGVPLQDALDKIALVFAGDWVKHDDVLRLETSPAKVEALHRELFEKQVARVKATLDGLKKRLAEQQPLDTTSAPKVLNELLQLSAANQENSTPASRIILAEKGAQMPTTRLGMRIISQMDPAELVKLAEQGRFVYSSNANAGQYQLPPLEPAALEEWKASRQAVNSAFESMGNNPDPARKVVLLDPNSEEILRDRQSDDRLPARILVTSQTFGNTLPIFLGVNIYDEEGRVLAQDSQTLGTGLRESLALRQTLDEGRRKAAQTGFELGPVGKELAPRIGANRGNLRPLPQFVIDALSHPTQQDPLSFAASDIILTSAELQGVNAIALLDDTADQQAKSSARSGKTTFELFRTLLEREDASKVSLDPDWLVVRPTEPIKVLAGRAPRPVLEQLIEQDLSQNYLTIEQVADAAYNSSRVAMNFMQGVLETIHPSNGNDPTYNDWNALWLFASLTPAQRERAAGPGGLDLSVPALKPEQAEATSRFVLQGDSSVEGVEPPQKEFKPGDIYPEPVKTDYFPTGITPDCVLNFTLTDESVLFQEESYGEALEGMHFWSPMDPRGAAGSIGIALHPELFPDRSKMFYLSHLQPGTKRTLTVRLSKGKLSLSSAASEQHLTGGVAMTPQQYLDSLPDSQRIDLQRKIDEFIRGVQARRDKAGDAPSAPDGQKPPARARF